MYGLPGDRTRLSHCVASQVGVDPKEIAIPKEYVEYDKDLDEEMYLGMEEKMQMYGVGGSMPGVPNVGTVGSSGASEAGRQGKGHAMR